MDKIISKVFIYDPRNYCTINQSFYNIDLFKLFPENWPDDVIFQQSYHQYYDLAKKDLINHKNDNKEYYYIIIISDDSDNVNDFLQLIRDEMIGFFSKFVIIYKFPENAEKNKSLIEYYKWKHYGNWRICIDDEIFKKRS
jgi:hypothetical protein